MNIAVGCLLVVVTTAIHAMAMVIAIKALERAHARHWVHSAWARVTIVATLVLIMFLATLIESALWAATYDILGALSDFDEAFYFSTVTYTTLGFGDITLRAPWRVLSSLEAANGIIMFGWSTAVIMAVVQRVYFPHPGHANPPPQEGPDV